MRSDADEMMLKEKFEREFHQEYNLITKQDRLEIIADVKVIIEK